MAANASDELARLQGELAELKAKSAELADQFLRAKAEAENARRRAEDEVAKARKFGIESFAESLLPVADSLDAALAIRKPRPSNCAKEQTRPCASSPQLWNATRCWPSIPQRAPSSTHTSIRRSASCLLSKSPTPS